MALDYTKRACTATAHAADYTVIGVTREACSDLILDVHYAGRWPTLRHAFGLCRDGTLVGCVTYGPPAAAPARKMFGAVNAVSVLELNRLVLRDNIPNEASLLVRCSMKLLAAEIGDLRVVSYADLSQGHIGTIYQAAGFTYVGLGPQRYDRQIASRPDLHAQSLVDHLKAIGKPNERPSDTMRRVYTDDVVSGRWKQADCP